MCEFTGMDLEMEIHSHYNELLHGMYVFLFIMYTCYHAYIFFLFSLVVHGMFYYMFTELETNPRYKRALQVIRQIYPRYAANI